MSNLLKMYLLYCFNKKGGIYCKQERAVMRYVKTRNDSSY